ncbi:aldehyde dehydrogenase family protein [Mesorhizobium sp. YM1C-6-2]|uniref:aldehyde dehydrogenase family protein n=1 Tax=Mesorhizobium sp. YM1C-6-2 TaxID=1827501 RepID=UPI000EF2443E|nr:aldehyde dehydrogenase family protein [Mesorhizobium sp. YM1C-6-2]RLP22528.1 aldehyde dehydrogenase family protein [Mesorhizobium sp. YM1C-6-2]
MVHVKDVLKSMDYGPAPEGNEHVVAWLETHKAGFGHFIDGKFTDPAAGKSFRVTNPADGKLLARAAHGTAEDVDRAVAAATRAFKSWSKLSGHERAKYLYAIARNIQKRDRFLAVLETMDNGKPIRETRDIDIPLVSRHFYHHAGWAELLESEFPGYQPVGVCGQIIPWNFPLLMLAWKIAPALAAGNTVVLKPAEQTPLTALAFAEICREVGLPAGVVNIVTGEGDTGAALVAHEGVQKIAFTGSTDVGRIIRTATAGSGKKLSLELGGKSPFIVFDDADLDSAVEGLVDAIWFNQGEVCCAGSRLLVQEGIAEKLYAKVRARMEMLRVGSPLDKSTDIGAVVSTEQLERITSLVAKGKEEGAEVFQPSSIQIPGTGTFFAPTLMTGVEPASTVAVVEIFGPVLVAMTFRTPDEAVALANNTRFGLAASIWSENINRSLDVASRLKAGVIWINATNLFDAAAGFGGYRESGYGREGGREGLYEYLAIDSAKAKGKEAAKVAMTAAPSPTAQIAAIDEVDRTAKLYIGGKQARPDSGYSYAVVNPAGKQVGLAGLGNRKDVRNAVEAAAKAESWGAATAHNRAQILYYIAENLSARAEEFEARLRTMTGASKRDAAEEVATAIRRTFFYAGFADKHDGAVHSTKSRHVTLAMNEPFGVMGVLCPDEAPLAGFVSLVMPALATGNRVIAVPSSRYPLAATDFYQIVDTSDVPAGVLSIVTGNAAELAKTLADHDEIAALWNFNGGVDAALVDKASSGNLKPVWNGGARNWQSPEAQGREFLRRSTQVKNIWVPYGE